MAVYKTKPPVVSWDRPKEVWEKEWGNGYTNLPNDFNWFTMLHLPNNQYKVFAFLTTVAYGNFKLHKQTLLSRTGLTANTYYSARQALVDKGWINIQSIDSQPLLIINTAQIYQDYLQIKEEVIAEDNLIEEEEQFIF